MPAPTRDIDEQIRRRYAETWESRRYHAARFVWVHRHECTPIRGIPWPQWWEQMYGAGETFDGYARRLRRERV